MAAIIATGYLILQIPLTLRLVARLDYLLYSEETEIKFLASMERKQRVQMFKHLIRVTISHLREWRKGLLNGYSLKNNLTKQFDTLEKIKVIIVNSHRLHWEQV